MVKIKYFFYELKIWAHLTLLLCGALTIGLILFTHIFGADVVIRVPSVEAKCK